MVITVAVEVAKTINEATQLPCPPVQYVGFRPTVLGFSFYIKIKFLMSFKKVIMASKFNCDAETRSKNRGV